MFRSLPLFIVVLALHLQIDAGDKSITVHEKLYNFVTEFRDMKPSLFNQQTTWQKLQRLLENGASFTLADIDVDTTHRATGANMLYCATRSGCLQAAHYLLSQGANPNLQDRILGNAPLHAAAEKGYDDFILYLCKHKANPNIVNHDGQTPLHKAVLAQQPGCVAALLSRNVHRNITDKYGKQPIDYARARGYEAIIALLNAH